MLQNKCANVLMMLACWLAVMLLSGCDRPFSSNIERSLVPSYGKGPYEVIIFTDYFCPGCQDLEADLYPLLDQLLAEGSVRIIFVDAPVNTFTQLYARYFLFAAKTKGGFNEAALVERRCDD